MRVPDQGPRQWRAIATIEIRAGIADMQRTISRDLDVRFERVAGAPPNVRWFNVLIDAADGEAWYVRAARAVLTMLHRSMDAGRITEYRVVEGNQWLTRVPRTPRAALNTEWTSGEWIIDKFIRFVARDSSGSCFLWSMHCGDAGYGCQIATLTAAEERALYEWAARPDEADAVTSPGRPPLDISDRAPRSGSFVDSENALRFFSRNGDPELARWARIMFEKMHAGER